MSTLHMAVVTGTCYEHTMKFYIFITFYTVLAISDGVHGMTLATNCSDDFICHNGDCVSHDVVCDGNNDCGDWTDEDECTECSEGIYMCLSGRCLNETLKCNGILDCPDGDDEMGYECKPGEFCCGTEDAKCVANSRVCNGLNDCGNWADEDYCDDCHDLFECRKGRCLHWDYVCDGTAQCSAKHDDHSDETDCLGWLFILLLCLGLLLILAVVLVICCVCGVCACACCACGKCCQKNKVQIEQPPPSNQQPQTAYIVVAGSGGAQQPPGYSSGYYNTASAPPPQEKYGTPNTTGDYSSSNATAMDPPPTYSVTDVGTQGKGSPQDMSDIPVVVTD